MELTQNLPVKDLIADFHEHLSEALTSIESAELRKPQREIRNVLITGLGGSGIGGSMVAELAAPVATVPITVNKDYRIPAFVGEHTLVIACSYSGNTEETLMATRQALEAGAEVACIASGGELFEIARDKGLNLLSMQGGHPPRSMFGYSFSYLCYFLSFYGIADLDVKADLNESIKLLHNEEADIIQSAEELATTLKGKTPIIYAVSGGLGLATRWRQQLNENAKMLAWQAEIPEMNHNELVGWEGGNSNFVPVFLRHKTDFERSQKRIAIIKDILNKKTDHVLEVWSKGESAIARILYLVHFGDWVSYYLSEINGVDIMDIKSIDLLKSELSKLPV